MPYSDTELTSANKGQTVSESDTFTFDRYNQFSRHLPLECVRILDVGCNTGRGGEVLKSQKQDFDPQTAAFQAAHGQPERPPPTQHA